jgi:hypothetical protein
MLPNVSVGGSRRRPAFHPLAYSLRRFGFGASETACCRAMWGRFGLDSESGNGPTRVSFPKDRLLSFGKVLRAHTFR